MGNSHKKSGKVIFNRNNPCAKIRKCTKFYQNNSTNGDLLIGNKNTWANIRQMDRQTEQVKALQQFFLQRLV